MVKKVILVLFLFLFLSQFVLAIPTEIKIKTLPYHKVIVQLDNGGIFKTLRDTSNYFGDVKFSFSSDISTFDMYIQVNTFSGEKVYSEKYPAQKAVDVPLIELYPSDYKFPELSMTANAVQTNLSEVNQTSEAVVNVTTPTPQVTASQNKTSFFSGFALVGENGELNIKVNTLIYILGVVVVIVIIYFVVRRLKRKRDPYYYPESRVPEVKVRKMSEVMENMPASSQDKDFVKAQRKLQEAQADLNRLKNRDKVTEIQKKMDELQREVRRLQG